MAAVHPVSRKAPTTTVIAAVFVPPYFGNGLKFFMGFLPVSARGANWPYYPIGVVPTCVMRKRPRPVRAREGALRSVVLADFRFMFGNVLGLDLEGRVMDGDLEVSCDAVFDLLEHLGGMTVGEAFVVDDDVGGQGR